MTDATAAALRACAAGLYPDEAAVELLISHGGFLHRSDFTSFVDTFTSLSDGVTPMAQINCAPCRARSYPCAAANAGSSHSHPASPPAFPPACVTPSPAWTTGTCNS